MVAKWVYSIFLPLHKGYGWMTFQSCGSPCSFLCMQIQDGPMTRQYIIQQTDSLSITSSQNSHHNASAAVSISGDWISAVFAGKVKATAIDAQADGAAKGTGPKLKRRSLTQSTRQSTKPRPQWATTCLGNETTMVWKKVDRSSTKWCKVTHYKYSNYCNWLVYLRNWLEYIFSGVLVLLLCYFPSTSKIINLFLPKM